MAVEQLITQHIDTWTSALKTRSTAGRGSTGKIDLYGIKKLRELILELAVRGKLVPQDPNDEPASELLKRIAAEKAELLKQGKIKKQKLLLEISEEEKPFELPEGWEWMRLGFITNYGECDKAEPTDANADTWIVELEDIEKSTSKLLNRVKFSERPFKSSKNKFYKNDVLYGKLRPYLDKVLVADDSGVCTTEIIPIKGYGNILPDYIRLLLKSPRFIAYANKSTHGMNLPRLGTDKAIHAVVELTSIAEQARIVNKVDELMSLCDQLEQQSLTSLEAHQHLVGTLLATLTESQNAEELAENWARISQHFDTLFTTEASIDALKQTILQLAVMGKLVPQDPNDEPASELLKRIEQEKAQLVKEGKIKKHPPVEPLGEPALLPRSWLNIVVQDFADIRLGSTPDRTEKKYWNGDIPWVSSGEVANEVILDTKEKVTSEGFKNSSTNMIPAGSLLMAIIGQGKTRGQTAILGIDACTNQNVAAFVFNRELVDPEYVWFWAKSKYLSHRGDGHGGAQPALNGKKVRSFIFPLAPIKEQQRIVSEVKRFNDICDTLKSHLQSAQQTQQHLADALTDAALN
ncbi:Type I restriction-modification system, S subunit [Erwinia billingiae Eb661]|uniref:Type I restriction-modification system, S subunit n=1 Tax=Erwinia billingiae (strain Eb661) TaxID=634500 RepID=D8MXC1_ERWBE|nr:restriction endonuclease subunit S [Erwinia billingiae]CAX61478.1 Type I restriction-modification system, S subunit [Erwinia billingiae Eb661]